MIFQQANTFITIIKQESSKIQKQQKGSSMLEITPYVWWGLRLTIKYGIGINYRA